MIHGIVASGTVPVPLPVITSNGGGPTASISIPENTSAVTTVTATNATIFSIVGGADAADFDIDPVTGVLEFILSPPPNREAPADADTNNIYEVIVEASNGLRADTQSISVTVTDVNEFVPVITSNGGGSTASVSVAENTTAVTTVTATDADQSTTLTYSISGGADAAKFTINSSTGVLTFVSAPDFETPTDADTNNIYEVTVQVSDGSNTDTQDISVTVTDVASEGGFATFDGVNTNVTLSNGNRTATHNTSTSNSGARSTTQKSSGKYYFEFTLTTNVNSDVVGIMTAAATYTNMVTNGTNGGYLYRSGSIWSNNASAGMNLGGRANGDIIGVAVDLDNDRIWFRVVSPSVGNWNGSGTADPATNVGGANLSNYTATTLAPAVGFAATLNTVTTMNAGNAAFTGTVPSGFTSGWPT